MTKYKDKQKKVRTAGFTIIELMISIAVGSLVLMMLMQMIVMNVTARRIFEYQNFVTEQSLLITDQIDKHLNTLQPQRVIVPLLLVKQLLRLHMNLISH